MIIVMWCILSFLKVATQFTDNKKMNVLMFGWEFPPHISGGLGTACFGLTQALAKINTDILFVVPKADDHQPFDGVDVISASNVPFVITVKEEYFSVESEREESVVQKTGTTSKIMSIKIPAKLTPYFAPDLLLEEATIAQWNYQFTKQTIGSSYKKEKETKLRYPFSGGYGPRLLQEVERYAEVASEIAKASSFDVIHAHDWLTYPAGIAAKKISDKPLIVHVHATEYDRAGESIDERVYNMERKGMENADCVIAVSQLTKNIIVSRYHIHADKVKVVHNGVMPKRNNTNNSLPAIGKQVITFLGRITQQKGPSYFVEAAHKVLQKFPNVHFIMAGSGDLLPKMMRRVAALKMSSHFHFTGFLTSNKVEQVWAISNAFVMPSVSEPFGIAPLEAMMAGVPVIISNQSGVAEVVQHAIKVDFWNVEALASAICNLLAHKSLTNTIKSKSESEIKKINWDRAAKKINTIYHELTTEI
jgi:glycogen synthase